MQAIEEIYQYGGGQVYLRVTRQAPRVWRGEVGGSQPILFDFFQTRRAAARYLRGLIQEALPNVAGRKVQGRKAKTDERHTPPI